MNKRMINFYMTIAENCAKMSRAVRLQVGSVVVKNNNILSFSWNGTPAGWDNNCEYKEYCISRDFNGNYFPNAEKDYPLKDHIGRYRLVTKAEVIHAERNAIDKLAGSHESSKDATMFITHAPCLECAKSIYTSGIKEVFYKEQYRSDNGIEFLKKCGVLIEKI